MQIMRHKGLCTVSYPCDFGWWQLLRYPKNGEKTMTYLFLCSIEFCVNAQLTAKGHFETVSCDTYSPVLSVWW